MGQKSGGGFTSRLKTKTCLCSRSLPLSSVDTRTQPSHREGIEEMKRWQLGLGGAGAGYDNVNQMRLVRMVSVPQDRSLPMKRVLKHTVIAFSVVWRWCTPWLQELYVDKASLHYTANNTFKMCEEGQRGALETLGSDKTKSGKLWGEDPTLLTLAALKVVNVTFKFQGKNIKNMQTCFLTCFGVVNYY